MNIKLAWFQSGLLILGVYLIFFGKDIPPDKGAAFTSILMSAILLFLGSPNETVLEMRTRVFESKCKIKITVLKNLLPIHIASFLILSCLF